LDHCAPVQPGEKKGDTRPRLKYNKKEVTITGEGKRSLGPLKGLREKGRRCGNCSRSRESVFRPGNKNSSVSGGEKRRHVQTAESNLEGKNRMCYTRAKRKKIRGEQV